MTHTTLRPVAPRLRMPAFPFARNVIAASVAAAFMIAGPSNAQAAVASVCTGVSLPPSVVTNIIGLSLVPVVNLVDPLGLLGLNSGLSTTLNSIASGQPIGLQAVDTSGNAINLLSDPTCESTADDYTLNTPKGISIGGNKITGLGNGAVASAGELNSIAFGNGAATNAAATNSIAIGPNASVGAGGANSVALGSGANATQSNSVALGAGSTTSTGAQANYAGFGLSAPQTSVGEVSVGSAGNERKLTNVAAGSAATDAVNVAQLQAVATTADNAILYDSLAKTSSTLAGPVSVDGGISNGTTITNLHQGAVNATSTDAINGAQLFGVTQSVTLLDNSAVKYDNFLTKLSITLGGPTSVDGGVTNGTTITNLHQGAVTVNSTDAVNGAQLFATNQSITNIVNGTSGLVQQVGGAPGNGTITVGAATGGGLIDVTGTGGTRVITGLAAGAINATSTDAVNGSQLSSVTQSVTALDDAAVKYDNFLTKLSITLGGPTSNDGGVTNGTTITNLHQGAVTVNSTDAVNGAQLFATNQSVTNIVNGTSGLVQQVGGAPGNGTITVGAATGGSLIDMTGTGGTRVITGVSAGAVNASSTDAINGSQLFGMNQTITTLDDIAVKYDSSQKTSITLGGPTSNNGGVTGGTTITNLHQGAVTVNSTDAVNGAQLFATNQSITNIVNGTSGLVQQIGGSPGNGAITVGAATGGSVINVTGTGGNRTITGVGAGAVNASSSDAVNGSQLFALSQQISNISNSGSTKYFHANSNATDSQAGSESVAVGPQTNAMGDSAVGMGNTANASGDDSIAVGHNSQATNTGSVAIGLNSQSTGVNTVAIGTGAVATNSVAVGAGAQAGNGGAAFGDNAIALAPQQGTALGNGATVTADRGVAIGAGAQAARAGMNGATEKYSNAAVASTEGAVSVGAAGNERQITNVAGGTQATDAVNVRQLDAAVGTSEQYTDTQISNLRLDFDGVRKDASAGTASAVAMASMPQATLPGKSMLAAGVGNYNGQSALSIGISSLSDNGRWTIKGLASADTRRNIAVGGGMGFHW